MLIVIFPFVFYKCFYISVDFYKVEVRKFMRLIYTDQLSWVNYIIVNYDQNRTWNFGSFDIYKVKQSCLYRYVLVGGKEKLI